MSLLQLKSTNEMKLRRRAMRYALKVYGKSLSPVSQAFIADRWLDGYKEAVRDVRKVVKKTEGPEHNVGAAVMDWTEEMPP